MKKPNCKIKEIKTKKEMLAHFNLIKELNPKLLKKEYTKLLTQMLKQNYKMVGVFLNEKCIGISGYWIGTKIYCGKYLELDNIIIELDFRSMGIGKLLCDWLLLKAKKQKCKTLMLDAYLENVKAHQFYEREGFKARGYHFIKSIK